MGTRAQFFIGNPENLELRKYLGVTGFDGYPDGWVEPLKDARTEKEFLNIFGRLVSRRTDYASPDRPYPFPWSKDLFLTDYTYVWWPKATDGDDPGEEGVVMMTCFHRGWIEMKVYLEDEDRRDAYHDQDEELHNNVLAPIMVP